MPSPYKFEAGLGGWVVKNEDPILVIRPPRLFKLGVYLGLGLLLFYFGDDSMTLRNGRVGLGSHGRWVLMAMCGFAAVFVLSEPEIRLTEDRIVLARFGRRRELLYSDVKGFYRKLVTTRGHDYGALIIEFNDNSCHKIPSEYYFDVTEIIQSHIDREIPGYEKKNLTILAS